jgi:hypothetical protein
MERGQRLMRTTLAILVLGLTGCAAEPETEEIPSESSQVEDSQDGAGNAPVPDAPGALPHWKCSVTGYVYATWDGCRAGCWDGYCYPTLEPLST